MNLRVTRKLQNGVRIKWNIAPTCYIRTDITVLLIDANGAPEVRHISPNADWFDLVDLHPSMNYTLAFTTHYDDQESDPISLSFVTNPADEPVSGLSVAERAGLGTGVTCKAHIQLKAILSNDISNPTF